MWGSRELALVGQLFKASSLFLSVSHFLSLSGPLWQACGFSGRSSSTMDVFYFCELDREITAQYFNTLFNSH